MARIKSKLAKKSSTSKATKRPTTTKSKRKSPLKTKLFDETVVESNSRTKVKLKVPKKTSGKGKKQVNKTSKKEKTKNVFEELSSELTTRFECSDGPKANKKSVAQQFTAHDYFYGQQTDVREHQQYYYGSDGQYYCIDPHYKTDEQYFSDLQMPERKATHDPIDMYTDQNTTRKCSDFRIYDESDRMSAKRLRQGREDLDKIEKIKVSHMIDRYIDDRIDITSLIDQSKESSRICGVGIPLKPSEKYDIECNIQKIDNGEIPPLNKAEYNNLEKELVPEASLMSYSPPFTNNQEVESGKKPDSQIEKGFIKGEQETGNKEVYDHINERKGSLFKDKMTTEEYSILTKKMADDKLQFEASEILLDLSRKTKNPEHEKVKRQRTPNTETEYRIGESQMLEILSHERLKNEKLNEENHHLKLIVDEVKDIVQTKNREINYLEQKLEYFENEQQYANVNGERIESGILLLDKLQNVYRGEIDSYVNTLDQFKKENTTLKSNYDALKRTVASLIHQKRENLKEKP